MSDDFIPAPVELTETVRRVFQNRDAPEYGYMEVEDAGQTLIEEALYRYAAYDPDDAGSVWLNVFTGLGKIGGRLWEQECRVLSRIGQMGHPALPTVHRGGYHEENFAFISSRRAERNLGDHGALEEVGKDKVACLRQSAMLADALALLHGQGLMHGNLWPQTVDLVEDEPGTASLRLARFEMSSLVANLFRQSVHGRASVHRETVLRFLRGQGNRALACFPPERLRLLEPGPGRDMVETERSDVYGLGVIMWQLFFGPLPDSVLREAFGERGERAGSEGAAVRGHMRTQLRTRALPRSLSLLLMKMIEEDGRARPTSAQVCEDLSENFSAFAAQWLRPKDKTPYLLGVMSKKSDHTVGVWRWTTYMPSTPVGRRELIDLVADEARGASLVYCEAGFEGRDARITSVHAGEAKYVLLGKKGAWFCAPLYVLAGQNRQTHDRILTVRFVLPKERAEDLYNIAWKQNVPPCEVIDVDSMVSSTIETRARERPSWTDLLSACRPPERAGTPIDTTFLDALEWLLAFQEVELQAREYAYVRDEENESAVLLRFDGDRDRNREEGGVSRLFAYYANIPKMRPDFGAFFGSESLREQSPQLEVASDYNGRPNRYAATPVSYAGPDREDAFWVKREHINQVIPAQGWIRPQDDSGAETALWRQRAAFDEIRGLPGLINLLIAPKAIQGFEHYWDDALKGLADEGSVDGRALGARARLLEMLTLQPLYALLGPPGTGKTELVARAIAANLDHDRAARILVAAQSNYATDNLFERLIHLSAERDPIMIRVTSRDPDKNKITKPIQEHTIDKVADRISGKIKSLCRKQLKDYPDLGMDLRKIAEEWISRLEKSKVEIRERVRRSANVVFATCSGSTKRNVSSGHQFGYFDWVFVEEAAKAWPTEIIIPLVRGFRWTLVGDHKQLPAHRRREVEDFLRKCADAGDDEINVHGRRADKYVRYFDLFANLFTGFKQSEAPTATPGALVRPLGKLQRQFRMRADICDLVNEFYVEDPLVPDKSTERDSLIESPPWVRGRSVVWLDTDGFPDCRASGMWANKGEARLVVKVLESLQPFPDRALYAQDQRPKDPLAIITPYNQQRRLIASALMSSRFRDRVDPVEVLHNVHTIQGREAEIVVASLVRMGTEGQTETQRIGYLTTDSIINVLISRARRLLIIIGHFDTFFYNDPLAEGGSDIGGAAAINRRFWNRICGQIIRKRAVESAARLFADEKAAASGGEL